jgi:hypothetical protein
VRDSSIKSPLDVGLARSGITRGSAIVPAPVLSVLAQSNLGVFMLVGKYSVAVEPTSS